MNSMKESKRRRERKREKAIKGGKEKERKRGTEKETPSDRQKRS